MKKKTNKFLSLTLSIATTLSMLSGTVYAEEPDFMAAPDSIIEDEIASELPEASLETNSSETLTELSEIMDDVDISISDSSEELIRLPEMTEDVDASLSDFSGVELTENADFLSDEFLPDFASEYYDSSLKMHAYTFDDESFGQVFDSEELLTSYANQEFGFNRDVAPAKTYCGDHLSGTDAKVYAALKKYIEPIASGARTDTSIQIPMSDVGFPERLYASDFGLDKWTTDPSDYVGTQYSTLMNKISKYFNYSPIPVGWSVVRDCPYEFYWFDLTFYYYDTYDIQFYYDSARREYYAFMSFDFSFEVNEEYRGSNLFTTNPSKTGLVKKALANAKKIISAAASYSDTDKLIYYRDKIIALTDYNYPASYLSGQVGYGPDSNPWQIIWIFDNDPDTKVVCEGYAKSFKYLCDNTKFSHANIQCYWVKGDFGNGSWSDYHSWNIVHMSDGKNYLVDLTNCDDGGADVDPNLFMASPYSGNVTNGFWFSDYDDNYLYEYDKETLEFYSQEALTISFTPFSAENAELPKLATPVLASVTNVKNGVTFKWNPVDQAEKYRVFRKIPGGNWTRIGLTTSTSFTDTTAVPGTKYAYTVRCTDITGSVYTSSCNQKGLSITYIAPPSLTSVTNTEYGVTVKWKASKGAEKYRISEEKEMEHGKK